MTLSKCVLGTPHSLTHPPSSRAQLGLRGVPTNEVGALTLPTERSVREEAKRDSSGRSTRRRLQSLKQASSCLRFGIRSSIRRPRGEECKGRGSTRKRDLTGIELSKGRTFVWRGEWVLSRWCRVKRQLWYYGCKRVAGSEL